MVVIHESMVLTTSFGVAQLSPCIEAMSSCTWSAIEDAKRNAKINGIDNVEFFVGAAEEVLPAKYKESNGAMKADVVVVDPPRKGCDEALLATLVNMEPERIVYVSCDPATLARDVKWLGENGYGLEKVRGCDMFGWTKHVETVVLITKN